MKKKGKKDFWERQGDQPFEFRMWDKHKQLFTGNAWSYVVHNNGHLVIDVTGINRRWIIQQCTGCRDRNDNLIFEGDILETNEAGWCGVVIYRDGQFALEDTAGGFSRWPDWEECKVIGNVYQNPELIP